MHPDDHAAASQAIKTAADPPTESPPFHLHEVLQEEQLAMATIHVRWLPPTEVFDFPIDEATTVFAQDLAGHGSGLRRPAYARVLCHTAA